MKDKNEIVKMIQKKRTGVLATVDNGKPRLRPMDIGFFYDDRLYFSTFSSSDKVSQMRSSADVEVLWMLDDMSQIRLEGQVEEVMDAGLKVRYLNDNTDAKGMFGDSSNKDYLLFRVTPVEIKYMDSSDSKYNRICLSTGS